MSGEVGQVGLSQNDGARFAQAGHHRGIVVGDQVHAAGGLAEAVVAGGGDLARLVDIVLDHHRYPVQRAARARGGVLAVEGGGGRQRIRVHGDERVIEILVTLDAAQKRLRELNGGVAAFRIVGLDLFGGELDDVDVGSLLQDRRGLASFTARREEQQPDGRQPAARNDIAAPAAGGISG